MCLVLRHDKIHDPRPRRAEWEPEVYYGAGRRRASFHTSTIEVVHLIVALGILTAAFAFWLGGVRVGDGGFVRQPTGFGLSTVALPELFIIAFVAIGSGFILHELMHKFVAQYYGHWAEFRAKAFGLAIPIPIALFTGFIFAAPGAVVISGFVRKHENGIISAAGPLTNIIIGFIALPFTMVLGSVDTLGFRIATVTLIGNAFLAIFNMIPLGPLDGRKVLAWSKTVYFLVVGMAILLMWLGLARPW